MSLLQKKYSILLFFVLSLLAFVVYFYVASKNYPIMPWTTKKDILLHLDWMSFMGSVLVAFGIAKIHWWLCERF